MNPQLFAEFNHRLAGEVVVPGSPTYDELRKVFNGRLFTMHIGVRPGVRGRAAGIQPRL